MSTVKLPFSGPTVCEDGAVSLVRVGQQRRRSWRSRLADKRRRSRKCSCQRSAPIGWLPLTGREGRVVRCTSSGRLCIPVTGARGTAAFLPLLWSTILDDLRGETMFPRSSWISTQFKAVWKGGYGGGWLCGKMTQCAYVHGCRQGSPMQCSHMVLMVTFLSTESPSLSLPP